MGSFPLPFVPSSDFRTGGLAFGNDRGKVEHAACDLLAPAGTPVLAIEDGVVWYGPSKFFDSKPTTPSQTAITTFEMAVVHGSCIARYGEIGPTVPSGVAAGKAVTAGQTIAFVARQNGSTMLHFEMFSDTTSRKPLTQPGNATYENIPPFGRNRFNRRSDLLDPTMRLNILIWSKMFGWGI